MKIDSVSFLKFIAEHQPCTSDFLAAHFSVSSRTVKNYVKEFNQTYNAVITSSIRGYSLNDLSVLELLQQSESSAPQSSQDRILYILNALLSLETDTYLDMYELCEELYISYSTLKKEIAKLKGKISSYHLQIINKRDSIALSGSESDKRKLISDVLYGESSSNFVDYAMIQNKFPDIDITYIHSIFTESFQKNGYFINDFSLTNLVLHTAISIDRIRHKNFSSQSILTPGCIQSHAYTITLEAVKQFERYFQIHYIELEIQELALLVMSRTTPIDYTDLKGSNISNYIQPEYLSLAAELLYEIKESYGIDLCNEKLLNCFSLHLQSLFIRSNNHNLNKNPLTNTIKTTCPFFFDVAVHVSSAIKKRTGIIINEDEISYIAIHLGCMFSEMKSVSNKITALLYCPQYYEMVQNLIKQIHDVFSNDLTIIDVAKSEQAVFAQKSIDLVISILPLSDRFETRSVQIGLFLNKQDQQKIQQMIAEIKAEKYRVDFEQQLRQLFLPFMFEKIEGFSSASACIRSMCSRLQKHGFADDRLYDEIMEREHMSSTAFDHFAIPHSTYMRSKKTIINILISKKPIFWNNNQVSIVILMCFHKHDRKLFQSVYETISSVLIERENVKKLTACNSYDEFIETFVSMVE